MAEQTLQEWDLWYSKAAANGLPFARSRIDPVGMVLVHSAPEVLTVTVRDGDGQVIAEGVDLERSGDSPMTRLRMVGEQVRREEVWPEDQDTGTIVLLPGGEAGRLLCWWNKADQSEWRWQIEFYNKK